MNKQFLESLTNAEWAGHLCRVRWEPRAGDLAVWLWISHVPSLASIISHQTVVFIMQMLSPGLPGHQ